MHGKSGMKYNAAHTYDAVVTEIYEHFDQQREKSLRGLLGRKRSLIDEM